LASLQILSDKGKTMPSSSARSKGKRHFLELTKSIQRRALQSQKS
jgi:hypothetical protein